jgi:hypothetical protein
MNPELKLEDDDGTFVRPRAAPGRGDTVLEFPF